MRGVRKLYGSLVESAGDCYARCLVRIRETFQSIELIRQAAEKILEGGRGRQVMTKSGREHADHRRAGNAA